MEKERLLGGGAGRLEYLRTRELLARSLPPAAATILDVGGGAGVYALPLANEGYSVYLVDPVPLHVEQATAASVAQPEAPIAGVLPGEAAPTTHGDCRTGARPRPAPRYLATIGEDGRHTRSEAW